MSERHDVHRDVERKTCPYCGAPFRRRMKGFDYFKCGTAQNVCGASPSRDCLWISYTRVTAERDDLRRQLAWAQERLAEAERVNSALDAALVSARRQLEQALAREAELRRVLEKLQHIWAWFCPTRRPNEPDEAYQRRYDKFHELGEALDAALSSAQANPYAAVVEAGRNFAVAAEQVLKAWDMGDDVSDAIEELREAALDYAAVEAGEPEFEVEVVEIEDQLEAGAPRLKREFGRKEGSRCDS